MLYFASFEAVQDQQIVYSATFKGQQREEPEQCSGKAKRESCCGHGCSGKRMLLKNERRYALGMDALVAEGLGKSERAESKDVVCAGFATTATTTTTTALVAHALGTRSEVCLGLGALVTVCSWNTNGIMLRAWMPWSPYALGARTDPCPTHGCSGRRMFLENARDLCFGHGCSGNRMSLKHERNHVASVARNPCVRCQAACRRIIACATAHAYLPASGFCLQVSHAAREESSCRGVTKTGMPALESASPQDLFAGVQERTWAV